MNDILKALIGAACLVVITGGAFAAWGAYEAKREREVAFRLVQTEDCKGSVDEMIVRLSGVAEVDRIDNIMLAAQVRDCARAFPDKYGKLIGISADQLN